jgi:hypothetical protein
MPRIVSGKAADPSRAVGNATLNAGTPFGAFERLKLG